MFILHTGRTLTMSPSQSQDSPYLILFPLVVYIYMKGFFVARPPVHYVAEDDLELLIFLPSSPKCWYYKSVLPHMVYIELGIKCMTLCMLKKHCACQTVPNLSLHLPQASYPEKYLSFLTLSPCLFLENPSWSRVYDCFIY